MRAARLRLRIMCVDHRAHPGGLAAQVDVVGSARAQAATRSEP